LRRTTVVLFERVEITQMSRKLLKKAVLLSGAAGPVCLFQQGGCTLIDPDIVLRAILLVLNESLVFALDNLAVSLR
jgi:hypothetical protein